MIIDCHCHAGRGDGLTGPWDTAAPLDRYLRRAARAGIDRTVLFAAFHSDYAVANREVARIVASRPDRFYGFAFVNAARDRGESLELRSRRRASSTGSCGIKVHRHDARITREVCEAARAFGLPVLYDVMGEMSVVELLAQEYPDVDLHHSAPGELRGRLARAAQPSSIIWCATPTSTPTPSGVRRFDLLEQAVQRAGARKILFGSDGPWLHPGVELAKVRALELSKETRRWCSAATSFG